MLMIIRNIYYVRQLPNLGLLHKRRCAFHFNYSQWLFVWGWEKRNGRMRRHSSRVFFTGVIKLQLSGWQCIALASQPCTQFSPNGAASIVSEATQDSEHKPTHTHTHTGPSSSFKAFQMSRGCISSPATDLLILVQWDNDSSLNETLENTATPFCYQTISNNQT